MAKVLNFGSLNLDYVYRVDHFVQPGETLNAASQMINPGGKGLNQSIALARAGMRPWHAGCLGLGGDKLAELLRANGVDTSYLMSVDELQGNAVIQVTPSGENCIVLFGGSNRCVSAEQIERTLASFDPGDWLVLQNEVNEVARLVDEAHARGMHVVLNPSPFDEGLREVDFSKLSWLLVNEVEARQVAQSSDPSEVWRTLHARYPQLSVLITLGSRGSVAYQMQNGEVHETHQDAFVVNAKDTTGAGDTFTGYFVASLMTELPLEDCMRRASMASALSVTREGAAASIPQLAEVEAALAQ
ncbi:MAG: ribokinase [Coriobacteriales bacterium]|nr:ribokinase [Coriobacteriales bacterium]